MKKAELLTLTYQERLDLPERDQLFLTQLMTTYQRLKRCLWQALYGRSKDQRPTDRNAFKRDFCRCHEISSTAYNSLKSEVDGLFKAQCELLKTRQVKLKAKSTSLIDWIHKQEDMLGRSVIKSPGLAPEHEARLCHKRQQTRFKLAQKRRKLAAVKRQLEEVDAGLALGDSWRPSVAFGSKALMKAQHHLTENGYEDHAAWKNAFDFARSNSIFLLGDQGETGRNREVKGIEGALAEGTSSVSLRLTTPEHLRALHGGKASYQLSPIELSPRLLVALRETLTAEYAKKVRKGDEATTKSMHLPVSYRFLRRKRTKTLRDGSKSTTIVFYIQLILQKLATRPVSTPEAGAIGIDQNLDHIAVGVVDRFGNPAASFTIPFRPYENTRDQNKALIGAIAADIVFLAEALKVPVVVEKLDFQRKVASLKEAYGPVVNQRFSAFSYSAFTAGLKTRCFKSSIQFIDVNPAYSSKIGALNYLGMKDRISSHEAACFTIARRGLNLRDYLNFGAAEALKTPAPLDEKTLPQRSELDAYRASRPAGKTGHVWGFIAQKGIKPKFKDLEEFYSEGNSWLGRGDKLRDAANPRRVALNYEALCRSG